MPDLRKVLTGVLRRYGHDVFLQRRLLDSANSPHPQPVYANKLEKYTVRRMHPNSINFAGVVHERSEGVSLSVDLVFYFQHDARPKEGDRIYEPDDRYADKQIVWKIDYAHAMRGRGGRVEFWTCGVTREEPN